MLKERITTSLIIPKIIFGSTIGIVVFSIALIYSFVYIGYYGVPVEAIQIIGNDYSVEMNESLVLEDSMGVIENGVG